MALSQRCKMAKTDLSITLAVMDTSGRTTAPSVPPFIESIRRELRVVFLTGHKSVKSTPYES